MNTIDRLLSASPGPQPRRPLDKSFTQATMAGLGEKPRTPHSLLRHFRLRPTVAVLSVALFALVGVGIYYSMPDDDQHFVSQVEQEPVKDPIDGRVIKAEVISCGPKADGYTCEKEMKYYHIAWNSDLTDNFVIEMARDKQLGGAAGNTLDQHEKESALERIKEFHPNIDESTQRGGMYDNIITAITPTSLSIVTIEDSYTGDWFADDTKIVDTDIVYRTYHTASDRVVVVDEKGQPTSWDSLKPGDHIWYVFSRPGDPTASPPDGNRDTTHDTLLAVMKNALLSGQSLQSMYEYDRLYGKEFWEVTPCKTDPSGYCRVE